MDPRAVVVVTRVAVKFGENRPTPEWTARRFPLLWRISQPSVSRMPYDVAWVWTCTPERYDQVAEAADAIAIPNGSVAVLPVEEMFESPDIASLASCHPGAERFLTFRLDADDAYLPSAIGGLENIEDHTIVDFANGYLWNGRRMRRFGSAKQGPFLALSNNGRENMVNQGGQHRQAREGRTVIRIERPAWVQTVHGENVMTSMGGQRVYWRTRVGRRRRREVLSEAGIL